MKSITSLAVILVIGMCLVSTCAFSPIAAFSCSVVSKTTIMKMGFLGGDDEPKVLTRDNEPDDYFATNTDKMTDAEKFPIAIAGLLGISLPFILGLIALYSSK